jgi:methyl-accepting chemotaxis protein
MEALVGSIAAVTEIVAQISASGDSQNSAVEQVSDTLNKMVAVTQRNSSMVEEIASSANDLSAQANTLVSAVAVFKLQPQNSSLRLR